MAGRDTLRSGDWLTFGRLRLWAVAVLIASAAGLATLVATSDGLNDYQGRPLGTDFSNIYVAGTYVLEGRPQAPFDPRLQHARAKEIFGAGTPLYGWHYPPFFHFVAAPLALLPYLAALALWQGVTLLLYLWSVSSIMARGSCSPSPPWGEDRGEGDQDVQSTAAPHPAGLRPSDLSPQGRGETSVWLLLALAFPAVFVNLGHGHNGFLTAALIGFALLQLDRRPVVAGILFGLLAYKPQFGLMIPLVLIATARWRTVFAAAATVAALALAVTFAFGLDVWRAFFGSAEFTRTVLEQGGPGWPMIQSVFAWVRMWGGSVVLAYLVQGATTLAIAAALVWLWRSPASFALKAAGLCLGAILATPYSLDYDMMVLAPAIAFLAADGLARGFAPYQKTALAALWLVPLVARSVAQATLVPLGVLAMLAMFALLIHSARQRAARPEQLAPA